MKIKNKWFWAFVVAAVALVAAVTVALVLGLSKPTPPDTTPTGPESVEDGPETGVYYYDVAGGEVLLSLNSGNKFTIAGPKINKSGEYTVNGSAITLDFVRDEDGTAQAEIIGDSIKLDYNNTTYNFIKKVYYKVNFNTNEGSEIAEISVLNGKTVVKPADPTKANNVFLGWYSDETLSTVFDFATVTITADTTVYAKWAPTVVGQNEYYASFDLNYDGAEKLEDLKTVGGKLYGVPEPKRQGYTFIGWFISDYEDAAKLTYAYTDDVVLKANTTLYAVWADDSSEKIQSPAVDVLENSIKWGAVDSATRYSIKITNAAGETLLEEELGATTKAFDFESQPAGDYVITVTALAANSANNSVETVRCFKNKALDRVSDCQVINGVIVFGAVKNAEKYIISVDCGNDQHVHNAFDNGSSTTFSIVNCAMQKGGIKITVTAQANGYASSVSETFVYERTLAAVSAVEYNKDTDTFVWNAVENAASYLVSVTVGDKTYTFDNGNLTSFNAAKYTGDITFAVVPVMEGYNSPDAVSTKITKTLPAAPEGLVFNGTELSWTAVDGASSYEVKIGSIKQTVTTNKLDLSNLALVNGTVYKVSVKTIKGNDSSAYCDEIDVSYYAAPTLSYKNSVLYWTPVVGVTNYEVRINGTGSFPVVGEYSAKITLDAGVNKLEVRFTDNGGCDWVSIEVKAFTVTYKTRSLTSGDKYQYVAVGDSLTLPADVKNEGYTFNGWYNTPSASAGNGVKYENAVFSGSGDLVLYADWTPNTYNIKYEIEGYDINNIQSGEKGTAVYGQDYSLTVPVSTNKIYDSFIGWYTGPGGSGEQLTDAAGNSVNPYLDAADIIAYPHFNSGVLSYELQSDGTYAVFAGPNFDKVKDVVVPQIYNGAAVTTIIENAFYNRKNVVTISIPDTIELVGINAFSGTEKLTAINVYEVSGNHKRYYSSYDGALIRDDMGTVYLEAFPRAKTGKFTIPEGVQIIRNRAFQYSKINTVIIANTVTSIQTQAFYRCSDLARIEFQGGRTVNVSLEAAMFYNTPNIKEIKLPAMINEINIDFFKSLEKLTTIDVEAGGTMYGSSNGMLTNAIGDTLIYAPNAYKDGYTVPNTINHIANGAFASHTGLTSIVIPKHVMSIGKSAFENCTGVTTITFDGGRVDDLTIGEKAFAGCAQLRSITFGTEGATKTDTGAIKIGANAFAPDANSVNLTTLTFGDGVNIKSIGSKAFADQTALYNLTYGKNVVVEAIGDNAFRGNTALATIEIHATTKTVGAGAYSGCTKAANVKFMEGGTGVSFGEGAFASCTTLVKIELPSTITSLQSSAFAGCDALAEVTVDPDNTALVAKNNVLYGIDANKNPISILFYPKTLAADPETLANLPWSTITFIGDSVFEGNMKVTGFEIPAALTNIGNNAFKGCTELTKVTFADGGSAALTVGNSAFASCTKLSEVNVPARTVSIGNNAFESCAFASFEMPANVTYVGNKAFASNKKLVAIVITDKITTLGNGAFKGCSALATVTFAEGTAKLSLGGSGSDGVFQSCTALSNVDFNGRVDKIGDSAFESSGLTAVDLDGVTEIGNKAFKGTKLSALTVSVTVVAIGDSAFESVSTLKTVTFLPGGTDTLTLGSSLFKSTGLTEITIPARVHSMYKNVSANSKDTLMVPDIVDMFSGVTTLKNIFVEEGNPVYKDIGGVLYELDENGVPVTLLLCPVMNQGTTVNSKKTITVPKTVTLVANRAFADVRAIQVVNFEEYAANDPLYNQQLLHIGAGEYNVYTISDTKNYSVFGSATSDINKNNTIVTINFPAHLAKIGVYAVSKTKNNLTVTFNQDAKNVQIGTNSFSGTSSKLNCAIKLPGVSVIGVSAFQNCSKISSLEFAPTSTLTEIGSSAFSGCSSITTLEIPASVVNIKDSAFSGTSKLKKLTFASGSNITEIGILAFANTNPTGVNALVDIDFTNATKLTTIGARAFAGAAVTTFRIPESVQVLGGPIFDGCTNLKTVILPASFSASNLSGISPMDNNTLQSIFNGLKNLDEIKIDAEGEIGDQLRTVDGVLYDRNLTILYRFPMHKDATNYKIPDTVKTIEFQAFKGFAGTEITFPSGLTTIKDEAFSNVKITSLNFPASVRNIGVSAFSACSAVTTITFGEGSQLEVIGDKAFYATTGLEVIKLPDSVKSIGNYAFYKSAITELVLPAALETIGDNAFQECERLFKIVVQEKIKTIGANAFDKTGIQSIYLPATLTSIGDKAFFNAKYLETVRFADGARLATIGESVFEGCKSLKNINVPASVMSVGANAFKDAASLETIELPNGVTTIGDSAFDGASSLKNFNIPAELTTIGNRAFANTAITSFTFSNKVTSIGTSAFEGCAELQSVVFDEGNTITTLGTNESAQDNIFKDTVNLKTVVLPAKLVMIGGHVFENSGITSLNLTSSVQVIGDFAFANCDGLTEISVYGNTTYIGDFAFYDCDELTKANISFGVDYLGSFAFGSCNKLTTSDIPSSVINLGANPYGDIAFGQITLDPENETFVYENGMLFNHSKTVLYYYSPENTPENGVVVIPESVTEIKAGAFAGATNIKSVTLPAKVKTVPDYAFYGCTNLETVTIESGITSIGAHAFDGCSKLNNVTVPATATTIGDYAFANCTTLSSFTFASETATYVLGSHMFENCISITEVILPKKHMISDELALKLGTTFASMKNGAITRNAAMQAVIPEYMFAGTGIVNAVLPESVTRLETDGVFMNCKNLESFSFVNDKTVSGTNLGSYLFYGCSKIEEISIPHGLTDPLNARTGGYTFANCTSLKKVTIGYSSLSGTIHGATHMFAGCTSLKEFVWQKWTKKTTSGVVSYTYAEDSIPYVGPYYFEGCTSLESFSVGMINTVSYKGARIAEYAFSGCTALKEFTITNNANLSPKAIKLFGDYAFKDCTALTNFTIDAKIVTYVDNTLVVLGLNVFDGWTENQTIKFAQNSAKELEYLAEKGTFKGCSAKVVDKDDTNIKKEAGN